jgi:hypothetical protein
MIGHLRPGRHTVTVEIVAPGVLPEPLVRTINLTVIRGGRSDEADG